MIPFRVRATATSLIVAAAAALAACGTLEPKTNQLGPGDERAKVIAVMGQPGDRQFRGNVEVLQYCKTGAGYGYHDFRMVWLKDGRVTGITSYKGHRPGSSCTSSFKQIDWSQNPTGGGQ